jgi:hypothetical protein
VQPGKRVVAPARQSVERPGHRLRGRAAGDAQGSERQRRARRYSRGAIRRRARILPMDDAWILFAEAGGVLALMLFFVWWTMRGKK